MIAEVGLTPRVAWSNHPQPTRDSQSVLVTYRKGRGPDGRLRDCGDVRALYWHHPLSVEDLMALVRMFGAQALQHRYAQDFTELPPRRP